MSIFGWVANEFGSKQGLLRRVKFDLAYLLGAYRNASPSKLTAFNRLVFICSGNICRSPYGEAISRALGFPTVSYGLHCRGGDPAFAKTLDFAQRMEVEVSNHRSQNIEDYRPEGKDLLVVMEPRHLSELEEMFPQTQKILIGLVSPMRTAYLHDPYNTNQYFFDKCLENIAIATQRLIESDNATR
ncbi:hypothetical protein QTP81_03350 [Alteromonas sp. ASW11-36]|uniref:protein-tyrosine-phosphatase n=1 Tax=Alteromonas arenosi TaxID=3055817 RepID=A0ABT7STX5_9ALTE|nr:hypothetical protein [Alteromonas sp. ASW11-36]MDM7859643.1 hypothetical protein [Alteromonas sp. ASW11-36]